MRGDPLTQWTARLRGGLDPQGHLAAFLESVAPLRGKQVLDLEAGCGVRAWRFAETAGHVYAVDAGVSALLRRLREQPRDNVELLYGTPEEIPLADETVDILTTDSAYFDGTTRCLPGVNEATRVLVEKGHLFLMEISGEGGMLGALLREALPGHFGPEAERARADFWEVWGFSEERVETCWRAGSAEELHAVLAPLCGEERLREIAGRDLSCVVAVRHQRKGGNLFGP